MTQALPAVCLQGDWPGTVASHNRMHAMLPWPLSWNKIDSHHPGVIVSHREEAASVADFAEAVERISAWPSIGPGPREGPAVVHPVWGAAGSNNQQRLELLKLLLKVASFDTHSGNMLYLFFYAFCLLLVRIGTSTHCFSRPCRASKIPKAVWNH